jgi:hypothetical protein
MRVANDIDLVLNLALGDFGAKYLYQKDLIPNLVYLIDITKYTHCQDPRDKLFAVLNLAPIPVRALLQPDYTQSISWTFAMGVKINVQCWSNLNHLGSIEDGTSHSQCPS